MNTEVLMAIIAGITGIVALLGWLTKHGFAYFTKKLDNRDEYIGQLVAANQANVENFVNTINHNQTKFNSSIDRLDNSIKSQTEVFKQLIKKRK